MPGHLQNCQMPQHVGGDVGERLLQRIAHAGLGCEMDNPPDVRIRRRQFSHRGAVGDVRAVEAKAAMPRQTLQPRVLQPHIVVGVDFIDADHLLAARQQRLGDVIADEAGGSGQQNGHIVPRLVGRHLSRPRAGAT